jgi:hypothetical protein
MGPRNSRTPVANRRYAAGGTQAVPKSGSLEIEASYAVTNLQDLLASLDTYFNYALEEHRSTTIYAYPAGAVAGD